MSGMENGAATPTEPRDAGPCLSLYQARNGRKIRHQKMDLSRIGRAAKNGFINYDACVSSSGLVFLAQSLPFDC
jgi:hypothetical protein